MQLKPEELEFLSAWAREEKALDPIPSRPINIDRFPEDFAFSLTAEEFADLKLQFATSSSSWGGRRKLPLVFTEHGAVMAASVLNTPIAVAASIQVVRVFVRLRQLAASHTDLARGLHELEAKHAEHDHKLV